MRAVTHWTLDFLPGLLYNVIFLGAALLYATTRNADSRVGARGKGRPGSDEVPRTA